MYFRKIEFHFNYKSSISNVKIKHKRCKSFPIWLIEKNFNKFIIESERCVSSVKKFCKKTKS